MKNDGELEKLKREESDANELKELVVKDEASTSLEPHEMKEEVIETFWEMTLWGEMHEELQNEKMTPFSEVDECIFQLNKELIATIVNQKEKKFHKNDRGRLCTQVAN